MKRLITTTLLSCVATLSAMAMSIPGTSIQSYNSLGEVDGIFYMQITLFNEDETTTLTVKNFYNGTKTSDAGQDVYVKELGSGTTKMMKDDVAQKYEAIVINALSLTSINALAFSNLTNVTTFTIQTTTPPAITETSFPSEWVSTCALTVPAEALEAYKASEWVNYFYSINGEVIDHNPPTPTAISNTEADRLSVKSVGNVIILSEATNVKVFSVTGQQIFSGVTNNVTVNSNGIYIVKTANTTQKVIVR